MRLRLCGADCSVGIFASRLRCKALGVAFARRGTEGSCRRERILSAEFCKWVRRKAAKKARSAAGPAPAAEASFAKRTEAAALEAASEDELDALRRGQPHWRAPLLNFAKTNINASCRAPLWHGSGDSAQKRGSPLAAGKTLRRAADGRRAKSGPSAAREDLRKRGGEQSSEAPPIPPLEEFCIISSSGAESYDSSKPYSSRNSRAEAESGFQAARVSSALGRDNAGEETRVALAGRGASSIRLESSLAAASRSSSSCASPNVTCDLAAAAPFENNNSSRFSRAVPSSTEAWQQLISGDAQPREGGGEDASPFLSGSRAERGDANCVAIGFKEINGIVLADPGRLEAEPHAPSSSASLCAERRRPGVVDASSSSEREAALERLRSWGSLAAFHKAEARAARGEGETLAASSVAKRAKVGTTSGTKKKTNVAGKTKAPLFCASRKRGRACSL